MTMGDDQYATQIRERAIKWAEGVAALTVLVSMRSCIATLEAMKKTENPLVRSVMFTGLVVNYFRGFEEVSEPSTGLKNRFNIRKLNAPDFSKTIHETLLTLRNQQIAHAGHALNDHNLTFLRVKVVHTVPQPDGKSTSTTMQDRVVGTRARASIATGPKTDMELLLHCRALEREAGNRLAKAIMEHDIASLFRLKQEHDEKRSLSKPLNSRKWEMPPSGGVVNFGEEDIAFSKASSPDALPLEFTVLTFNLVFEDGKITLQSRGIAAD